MTATAREGQCLADVALRVCGSLEGVWALAVRNGLSVTGELRQGQRIDYEAGDVADARVVSRYEAEGVYPATAISARALAALMNEDTPHDRPGGEGVETDPPGEELTRAAVFGEEFTAAFA